MVRGLANAISGSTACTAAATLFIKAAGSFAVLTPIRALGQEPSQKEGAPRNCPRGPHRSGHCERHLRSAVPPNRPRASGAVTTAPLLPGFRADPFLRGNDRRSRSEEHTS